ncbi:hypothetical protein QYF36_003471 [Acer negundo]|nr:hypothetical protein QYF36_003471 [Acer negundo]
MGSDKVHVEKSLENNLRKEGMRGGGSEESFQPRRSFAEVLQEVSSMTKSLVKKNVSSSSFYLGVKNVLWVFQSIHDKVEFVRCNSLWDECFSTLGTGLRQLLPLQFLHVDGLALLKKS